MESSGNESTTTRQEALEELQHVLQQLTENEHLPLKEQALALKAIEKLEVTESE